MKRAAVDHSVLTGLGAAFYLLLLTPYPAFAQEEEEQEGTQEQVEAEDNVTICVTDGVAKDGDKDLIVFDKDNPEEEWEVNARVKFRPKPEKEYILRDKKYNWTASEGFTVSKADDARPTIKATAEAAGTEGKLKLHLSWEEEKLDEDDNPTGEIKIHPWSNDKASMRLLVPEFELQSVSYNLGDNGETGALPFYDNGDPEKKADDPTNKPRLITAPEYVKDDTRPADNLGVLYKKGITPKMKAKFTIKPATAGDIVLYAIQKGLVPTAQSDAQQKLSGTVTETVITCEESLPDKISSGTSEHTWRWRVYGRQLEPKDASRPDESGNSGAVKSKVDNTFIVLNDPYIKLQEPWINSMKFGIETLQAKGAVNEREILNKIVPCFRNIKSYSPDRKSKLLFFDSARYNYVSHININNLYTGKARQVNCWDSAVSIFVVCQYLGSQIGSVGVVQKYPWKYKDQDGGWTSTVHTYNIYDTTYIYDATPVWANEVPQNGSAQQGILTERDFFHVWQLQDADTTPLGHEYTYDLSW